MTIDQAVGLGLTLRLALTFAVTPFFTPLIGHWAACETSSEGSNAHASDTQSKVDTARLAFPSSPLTFPGNIS